MSYDELHAMACSMTRAEAASCRAWTERKNWILAVCLCEPTPCAMTEHAFRYVAGCRPENIVLARTHAITNLSKDELLVDAPSSFPELSLAVSFEIRSCLAPHPQKASLPKVQICQHQNHAKPLEHKSTQTSARNSTSWHVLLYCGGLWPGFVAAAVAALKKTVAISHRTQHEVWKNLNIQEVQNSTAGHVLRQGGAVLWAVWVL